MRVLRQHSIIPRDILSLLFRNDKARESLSSYDIHSAIEMDRDLEITFHYNGEPVLYPGIRKEIEISLKKDFMDLKDVKIKLQVPKNWKMEKRDNFKFELYSEKVEPRNKVKVKIKLENKDYFSEFTILSPEEAKGWPIERNVDRCPECGARKGACICGRNM